MITHELEVRNGPGKADLLRAVTNPDKHLHVSFETVGDPLEAHIDTIEEMGRDGMLYGIRGHLTAGTLRGAIFTGIHDCGERAGLLMLKRTEHPSDFCSRLKNALDAGGGRLRPRRFPILFGWRVRPNGP